MRLPILFLVVIGCGGSPTPAPATPPPAPVAEPTPAPVAEPAPEPVAQPSAPSPAPTAPGEQWEDNGPPQPPPHVRMYIGALQAHVTRGWPEKDTGLRTSILVTIGARGELVEAKVATESGDDDADAAALAFVRGRAPYPVPPAELRGPVRIRVQLHR